jgi:tRNA G10  N-methylase Trm11
MSIINKLELSKVLKKRKLENHTDDILNNLIKVLNKTLEDNIRIIKNKNRIIINDNAKEHLPAKDVFSEEDIRFLPTWVKEDIDKAQVVGKSHNVIQTSDGKKYHTKNKLNDLPGGEWTFFLNSIINTRYSTNGEEGFAHHIRKIHPSPKPPQLMKQIIEFFTKENEIVFDYFMGVGGSLLGAALCGRKAVGIDLEPKYIKAYKEASSYLGLEDQVAVEGDSIELLQNPSYIKKLLGKNKASLILIDPPYGDMLSRPKTGEAAKKGKGTAATPFTDLCEDLGNMNWDKFLAVFNQSVINAMKHLKNNGHLVVFIKDLQPKDKELNLLHADIINNLNEIKDLKYLGTKIWADHSVNLYPYGYPYSYVSNQIHQYIMIFKKN